MPQTQRIRLLNRRKADTDFLLGRHMRATQRNHQLSLSTANYRKTIDELVKYAKEDLQTYWESGASYNDLIDIYKEYVKDASVLSGQYHLTQRKVWQDFEHEDFPQMTAYREPWSHVLWKQEKGFSNTDFNGLTYKEVMNGQARSGRTIDDLWPKLDTLKDEQDFLTTGIMTAVRESEAGNCESDPTHPTWARVPEGPNTCAFCLMLASRGFVYHTEESAGGLGNTYHDHCQCTVTPSWNGDYELDGYPLKKYQQIYSDAKDAAGKGAHTSSILDAIRRSGSSLVTDAATDDDSD